MAKGRIPATPHPGNPQCFGIIRIDYQKGKFIPRATVQHTKNTQDLIRQTARTVIFRGNFICY
jgi:hypothetical protein